MKKAATTLRLGALTRVSTERQEQQGESLRTQRKQIEEAAKRIGGTITKWYSGQEHATEGFERKRFAQMLTDAAHHRFDALMVADASRLTRDPEANQTLIKTFRANHIRLFVLEAEHDLNDPKDRFMLRMLADVHSYSVEQNIQKSIDNRIEMARAGRPVAGTLPFGRHYDERSQKWSADEACKKFLELVAKKLLRGESLEAIAKELNSSGEKDPAYDPGRPSARHSGNGGSINANTLRRRLLNAGAEYVQKFRRNDEIVQIKCDIPPLLPDATVARIRHQLRENKIVTRRGRVYPLAHVVRCAACGSVLSGAGTGDFLYYRHHAETKKGEACVGHVPAERLEDMVLEQIGTLLKDNKKLRETIKVSVEQAEGEVGDLEAEIEALEKREKKLLSEKRHLVDVLADKGSSAKKDVEAGLKERDEALAFVERELTQKRTTLKSRAIPPDLVQRVQTTITKLVGYNGRNVLRWGPESQRKLALYFLGGPVVGDRERGIWVRRDSKLEKKHGVRCWTYEIKGDLAVGAGAVTVTKTGRRVVVPQIDDEIAWQELKNELDAQALTALAGRVAKQVGVVKLGGTLARSSSARSGTTPRR
jgi:DNA invertase Pin-like site-specific DNA recombinase